jgi:mono/diheme cytochrome c family protein
VTDTEAVTDTETVTGTEGADPEATPAAEEEAAAGDPAATTGDAEAGGYLFTIARGCGCHFNRDLEAYAGGNEFEVPGGVVYSRNITPDPDTGIGGLSEADIAQLIHTGSLDDYHLHPVMPYRSYSRLSDEDALNLAAYLFTLEPVVNEVPQRELETEPEPFTPESEAPATSPTDPVERGEMLVSLARCGQCHTPANEDGSPNMDLFLAGNRINEDEVAWNITPDEETGIGSWSEEELANFLRTGKLADGSEVAGTMANNIENYFNHLTEEDAAAIAAYLMSLPPISNEPE